MENYTYTPPLTNNLPTFRILFLVKGVLDFFGSLFCLLYAFIGGFFMQSLPMSVRQEAHMPFNPGSIFLIVGCIGFVFTVTFGVLDLLASKYIKEQRNYTFVFVVSVLACMASIPGILLGVFSLIELNKPHVKALFKANDGKSI